MDEFRKKLLESLQDEEVQKAISVVVLEFPIDKLPDTADCKSIKDILAGTNAIYDKFIDWNKGI